MRPAQSKGASAASRAVLAQWKRVARISNRVRRVTAVPRVAREDRPVAQVFLLAHAIGADAAGRSEPGYANPLANFEILHMGAERIDTPDDFMPRNDGEFRVWQLAIHDVEIGPADAASLHPHAQLARAGDGIGQFLENQRRACFMQDHAEH